MSMYNLLHGENNLSPLFLAMLNIDQDREKNIPWPKREDGSDWDPCDDGNIDGVDEYIKQCIKQGHWNSGRFRDIYLNKEGTIIILFTRNGGGNRESYWYLFDILRQHPNYITDYDDDYDCTYASIEFSVPEEFKKLCKSLVTEEEPKTLKEKTERAINYIKGLTPEEMENDPRLGPLTKIFKEIFKGLDEQ
jgi:hypothetical protein